MADGVPGVVQGDAKPALKEVRAAYIDGLALGTGLWRRPRQRAEVRHRGRGDPVHLRVAHDCLR